MTKKIPYPLPLSESLIFLNGQRSRLDYSRLALIDQYKAVVATDGAWNDLSKQPLSEKTTLVIGDGDSIQTDLLHQLIQSNSNPPNNKRSAQCIISDNQETTDFEKAITHLMKENIYSADVLWGSAGEMDHFLGNLSIAAKYHKVFNLQFFDDSSSYFLLSDSTVLSGVMNNTITIYPFPKVVISSKGLTYGLNQHTLTLNGGQSLRNHANQHDVNLTIHSGLAFVFISQQAKPLI